MKKLLFGLSAILLCFMIASCGGSPTSKDKNKKDPKKENPTNKAKILTEDVIKNGNDWTDAEKWNEFMTDAFICIIDFADSDPSKKELEEFTDIIEELDTAINNIDDEEAQKALDKAKDDFDMDLFKKERKAIEKIKKLAKKYKKDDDDDADDED